MNGEKVLDISWGTLFKIGIACFIFYVLYLIKDILIWFIFALVISILFTPAIDFLQKRRVPRAVATVSIFVFVFGLLGLLIYSIAPIFVEEIQQFTKLFPQYFEKFAPPLKGLGLEAFESFEAFTLSFQEWLNQASGSILSAVASVFGGIFATIAIFILAIFLSLEEKGVERMIKTLAPKRQEQEVLNLWNSCQSKVSAWFGVRLLACLFVGLMSYIALWLFGINYPFVLALFAGVADIIPIIGPIMAGVVIALIAALDSPGIAILILIVFIIIQQIEGNILTPILTKRFIGLPPALVLIALMVGGSFWGILGAVLAIPLVGIVFEFTRDYLKKRKEGEIPPSSQPAPSSGRKKSIIW